MGDIYYTSSELLACMVYIVAFRESKHQSSVCGVGARACVCVRERARESRREREREERGGA